MYLPAFIPSSVMGKRQVVKFLYDAEQAVHCADAGVWTEILSPFLVYVAGREHPWELFFGNADAWVGLAVLQKNVVSWLVFLYKRVLEKQCVLLGVHHSVCDVPYLAHENFCLEAVNLFVEV